MDSGSGGKLPALEAVEDLRAGYGVTYSEIAQALGASEVTLHRWRNGSGGEPTAVYLQRLDSLGQFVGELKAVFPDSTKADQWLDAQLAVLNGTTPRQLLCQGQFDRLIPLLSAQKAAGTGVAENLPKSPLLLERDSGWYNLGVPRVHTGILARRGEEILKLLAKRSIKIPAGNRIDEAIKTLDKLSDRKWIPSEKEREKGEAVLEAIRTLWEAFLIVDAAYSRPWERATPFTNDVLKYLLEGAPTSKADANPRARDIQFEMYIAALFTLARADILPGEPDLRFLYHGEYLGIAAKRVRSLKVDTLREAMAYGGKQLANHKLRGFLALNVDAHLDNFTLSSDATASGRSFNQQIAHVHEEFRKMTNRPAVIGIILLGNRAEWIFDGAQKPTIRWNSPMQVLGLSDLESDERLREYFDQHFAPRLQDGLRRVARLVSGENGTTDSR